MADDDLWDTPLGGVILGLICSFGSTLTICLIIVAWWYFRISDQGRILLERFSRPGQFDEEQRFAVEEAEALQTMDPSQKAEYLRAKCECIPHIAGHLAMPVGREPVAPASPMHPWSRFGPLSCADNAVFGVTTAFIQANPPESVQTDISLSQYLAIQEKGVSAWEFEPELEIANCFVEARTEIEFFDSECTVMSNLPVPKQNEVYYWEAKIFEKPETTLISIGMATKPYPLFRLPGKPCRVLFWYATTPRAASDLVRP